MSGPSSDGNGGDAPILPLKDEDYSLFARILNSGTPLSNSTDRISSQSFKKGLLKYGIVCREDDAVMICLEINSTGGDLLVSSIRSKVSGKDPKLSTFLKRYIRIVLDNQQGRTRDRVLGKIISRAGETMTPELNLLRSPMNAYKYVEGELALDDQDQDDIIDVVPTKRGIVEPSPTTQRSHASDNPPNTRASIHSSSRDRVLGKIISHAVSSLEKSSTPAQSTPSSHEATPPIHSHQANTHSTPHHSSRDRVLSKIISNAVGVAGGSGVNGTSDTTHLPSIAKNPPQEASSVNQKSPQSKHTTASRGSQQGDEELSLQDYDDQPPTHRKSFARQESRSEPRRRATYDPEKHSSLYASSEYLQVDMSTDSDNRHLIDRELSRRYSREDSKLRRHSENSICDNPEILEQMKSVRDRESKQNDNSHYQPLPRSPSKIMKTANAGTGRVRNKILNRMVNRVKETVLSSSETNSQRPLSGRLDQEYEEPSHKLKEKLNSPASDTNGRWFHSGKYSSTVAIDNSEPPDEARDNKLRIQTMESRTEGDMNDKYNHSHSKRTTKMEYEHKDASPMNPLRHILSDAHLIIPPNEGSFSPGHRKSSPLHLNVSTPQPYQGTYRRTINHHSPEDRALTPEPDAESCDGNEDKTSEWNRHDDKKCSATPHSRDKWVGAAPVLSGNGDNRNRNYSQAKTPKRE